MPPLHRALNDTSATRSFIATGLRRTAVTCAAALAGIGTVVPGTASAAARIGAATTRCGTSGLVVWLDTRENGAAGSLFYTLEFTNLSGRSCSLLGYPGLSAVDLGGRQLGSPAGRDAQLVPRMVLLSRARPPARSSGSPRPGTSLPPPATSRRRPASVSTRRTKPARGSSRFPSAPAHTPDRSTCTSRQSRGRPRRPDEHAGADSRRTQNHVIPEGRPGGATSALESVGRSRGAAYHRRACSGSTVSGECFARRVV